MHASMSARAPMRRDMSHAASVRAVNLSPPSQFIPSALRQNADFIRPIKVIWVVQSCQRK